MNERKKAGAAAWTDPDDAPELTDEFFERAEIRDGDVIIRPARGRPRTGAAKVPVSIRLDAEVVAGYRAKGEGWQAAMNRDLRDALAPPSVRMARAMQRARDEAAAQHRGQMDEYSVLLAEMAERMARPFR